MELQTFIDHLINQSLELAFTSQTKISDRKSYIGATQTFETRVLLNFDNTDINMFLYTELFDEDISRTLVMHNSKNYGYYENLRDAEIACKNIAKLLVKIHSLKSELKEIEEREK